MLKDEWLSIGYEKGLIDDISEAEQVTFESAYHAWFKTKINRIRPQSVDRIEYTYKKYYADSDFVSIPVHLMDERTIYSFLNGILLRESITKKEYQRIYQVVNNVMQFAFDVGMGHAYPVYWQTVKRYVALQCIQSVQKHEYSISESDRERIARAVLVDKVYSEKQCACLCFLLNFYLGLRIGELASLTWQDVHIKEKYIYVHSTEVKAFRRDSDGNRVDAVAYHVQDATKTISSVRRIPLTDESLYILYELSKWHKKQGYVNKPLAYDGSDCVLSASLPKVLARLCDRCGVVPFSSHKIRKTFATELHRNGMPTKDIAGLMGHSEIRTTEQNYIIDSPDAQDAIRVQMQIKPIIDIAAAKRPDHVPA